LYQLAKSYYSTNKLISLNFSKQQLHRQFGKQTSRIEQPEQEDTFLKVRLSQPEKLIGEMQ